MHQMNLDIQIEAIATDHEHGVVSAIETEFPGINRYGCYFHYSKAFMQKFKIWAILLLTAQLLKSKTGYVF